MYSEWRGLLYPYLLCIILVLPPLFHRKTSCDNGKYKQIWFHTKMCNIGIVMPFVLMWCRFVLMWCRHNIGIVGKAFTYIFFIFPNWLGWVRCGRHRHCLWHLHLYFFIFPNWLGWDTWGRPEALIVPMVSWKTTSIVKLIYVVRCIFKGIIMRTWYVAF